MAGPTFVDGFDHYNSSTFLAKKWGKVVGTGFTWVTGLRSGVGNALTMDGSSCIVAATLASISSTGGSLCTYIARSSSNTRRVYYSYDGANLTTANQELSVGWNADGTFTLYDSADASLGSSTLTAPALNHAYHLEVRGSGGSNPTIIVYIDGQSYISASLGVGKTYGCVSFSMGGTHTTASSGTIFTIDHTFVRTAGAQIGLSEILYFPPTSDGTTSAWSASDGGGNKYAMVDENPPDVTDYIFPTANSQTQMCKFPVTLPAGYTGNGWALTALGSVAAGQVVGLRYENTDGGADQTFDNGGTTGTAELMYQGTVNNNPTLVSGNAIAGVRRTT